MNKALKEFNEYLWIAITIWAVLWGYFQVIWLWGVWIEYIRFFSSTQIISDGIIWIIVTLLVFWLYELWKNINWFALTIFLLSSLISTISFFLHYYSITIFLAVIILPPIWNFISYIFTKIWWIDMIKTIKEHIPLWIYQWIGVTVIFTVFWILCTYIASIPKTLYINEWTNAELNQFWSWTRIHYFNDKYLFMVNDVGTIRKVKIFKTEEVLISKEPKVPEVRK